MADIGGIRGRTEPIEAGQRADPAIMRIGNPHRRGHGGAIAQQRMVNDPTHQLNTHRRLHRHPVVEARGRVQHERGNAATSAHQVAVVGEGTKPEDEIGAQAVGSRNGNIWVSIGNTHA